MNKRYYIQKAILMDGQSIAEVARSLNNCQGTVDGILHNVCKKTNKTLYINGMKLKAKERNKDGYGTGWKYKKPSLEFLKKHANEFMSRSNATHDFCCPHCGKGISVHPAQ